MKTIYLDSDFRCYLHLDNPYAMISTSYFDGKCQSYIEGYRYVPIGYTWVREDGKTFSGEMVCPTVDLTLLEMAQAQYEQDLRQMQDMQDALDILGVES